MMPTYNEVWLVRKVCCKARIEPGCIRSFFQLKVVLDWVRGIGVGRRNDGPISVILPLHFQGLVSLGLVYMPVKQPYQQGRFLERQLDFQGLTGTELLWLDVAASSRRALRPAQGRLNSQSNVVLRGAALGLA